MNEIPVFPKWSQVIIRLDDEGESIVYKMELKTRLRKYCDVTKKWYYRNCFKSAKTTEGMFKDENILFITQAFIEEIYLAIMYNRVAPRAMMWDAEKETQIFLFEECETQETEEDRIKSIFSLNGLSPTL